MGYSQINNTIFERKHHYMYILKESEVLKRQMNEELFDGNIEPSRLDEINFICNYAFAGLIQEGLEYQYAKDTDPTKDTIVITVDHVDYKCRATTLKTILGNRYSKYITNGSPAEKSFAQKEPIRRDFDLGDSSFESEILSALESCSVPQVDIVPPTPEITDDELLKALLEDDDLGADPDTEEPMPFEMPKDESEEVHEETFAGVPAEKEPAPDTEEPVVAETAEESKEDSADNIDVSPAVAEVPATSMKVLENDTTPVIQNFAGANLFIEEVNKHKDTFVFQTQRIMALHDGMSKGEEITFTIAPLEIKKNHVNVPIMVYAYLNGKNYVSSSLQNADPDKKLVVMQIGDYELLIRAVFNEGKFAASVFTTGISLSQNDHLNVLDVKDYAPKNLADAKNGHVKFSYHGEKEQVGVIDVFPIDINDNNFVVIKRIGEWTEHYCTEDIRRLLMHANGEMQELICLWENDVLKSEFVPAY